MIIVGNNGSACVGIPVSDNGSKSGVPQAGLTGARHSAMGVQRLLRWTSTGTQARLAPVLSDLNASR
jgi:hypothetical protein